MAHPEQNAFVWGVRSLFPDLFTRRRVIEIGSLDINGSVRNVFDDCEYVGVDIDVGPGVDVVCPGQYLAYDQDSFDVAISAECFEHNPYWVETFQNMYRMTSGLVIVTCATTGRFEHGTSQNYPDSSPFTADEDYYKNLTAEDLAINFDLSHMFSDYSMSTNDDTCDLYFWGKVDRNRKPLPMPSLS